MTSHEKYPVTTRTDRYFLRVIGDPIPGAEPVPIKTASLHSVGAGAALERILSCPGRMQGGLLFGYRDAEDIRIGFASPAGVRPWHLSADPTDMDAGYVLGWMDCLRDAYSITPGADPIDWIGNWIAYPDGRLHTPEEDHHWFQVGRQKGLFDEEHLMLVVGWQNGQLGWNAYIYDSALDAPVPLEITKTP